MMSPLPYPSKLIDIVTAMNVTDLPYEIFTGNRTELDILKNYLTTKNVSVRDVVLEFINNPAHSTTMIEGLGAARQWTADSVMCLFCMKLLLKHIMYAYRERIPNDQYVLMFADRC